MQGQEIKEIKNHLFLVALVTSNDNAKVSVITSFWAAYQNSPNPAHALVPSELATPPDPQIDFPPVPKSDSMNDDN